MNFFNYSFMQLTIRAFNSSNDSSGWMEVTLEAPFEAYKALLHANIVGRRPLIKLFNMIFPPFLLRD